MIITNHKKGALLAFVAVQLLQDGKPDKFASVAPGRVCSAKWSPVSGAITDQFVDLLDALNRYGHDQPCNRLPVKLAPESHAEYLVSDDLS
jgi:hypothetical protein